MFAEQEPVLSEIESQDRKPVDDKSEQSVILRLALLTQYFDVFFILFIHGQLYKTAQDIRL